jgi:hypothetical protein
MKTAFPAALTARATRLASIALAASLALSCSDGQPTGMTGPAAGSDLAYYSSRTITVTPKPDTL